MESLLDKLTESQPVQVQKKRGRPQKYPPNVKMMIQRNSSSNSIRRGGKKRQICDSSVHQLQVHETEEPVSISNEMSHGRKPLVNSLTLSFAGKQHKLQSDRNKVIECHDRRIYDVLPWRENFENMVTGTVLLPSMNNQNALTFLGTIDAGCFQPEARRFILYLFNEDCPNPKDKTVLALFIQMSNKDLVKIKCQSDECDVSFNISNHGLGTPDKQKKLEYAKSPFHGPVYISIPSTHYLKSDLSILPYSNKTYRDISLSNLSIAGSDEDSYNELKIPSGIYFRCQTLLNEIVPTLQDKRIVSTQKAWQKYQVMAKDSFPEVIDHSWQPCVVLRKLKHENQHLNMQQGIDVNFGGCDDVKNICAHSSGRRKRYFWKVFQDRHQAARTAQFFNVNELSPANTGHVGMPLKLHSGIHCKGEATDIGIQNHALQVFEDEVYEIENFLNLEGIKTGIEKLLNQNIEAFANKERSLFNQSDHESEPYSTHQVIKESKTYKDDTPMASVSSNANSVNVTSSSKDVDLHVTDSNVGNHRTDDLFRDSEDDSLPLESPSGCGKSKRLPVKKMKLCSFVLPGENKRSRKNHKSKNGKHKPYLGSVETIKRQDYSIRIWQNFNREAWKNYKLNKHECSICKKAFSSRKTLKKHTENFHSRLMTEMGELPIKEHYYCELCNVTALTRCGLDRHSLSVKHKTAVNAQLEAIILSMRVAGMPVKADQCADQKLELVEIMEETLVDDANSEREEVDRNENILFCNKEKNKTTKKIKTYVYQVAALVQLKKMLEVRDDLDEEKKSYIPLSQFLNEQEENLQGIKDYLEWFAPHRPEDDASLLCYSGADESAAEKSHKDASLPPNSSPLGNKDSNQLQNELHCADASVFSNAGSVANKARIHRDITSNETEWLEEEVIAPDLRFHENFENNGAYFIKKNKKLSGKVVLCKRRYSTYKNKKSPCLDNARQARNWLHHLFGLRSLLTDDVQTNSAQKTGYYSRAPHSPYYPHPLIREPQELYTESLSKENTPEQIGLNMDFDILVPHHLYEKRNCRMYVDLDKPSEFYRFDVDKDGNFITSIENIKPCSSGSNSNDPLNDESVSGKQSGDTFEQLLESTSAMRAHPTDVTSCSSPLETEHPAFTCTLRPDLDTFTKTNESFGTIIWQPNSTLNTPVWFPVLENIPDELSDTNRDLGLTPEGFDKEFDELWKSVEK